MFALDLGWPSFTLQRHQTRVPSAASLHRHRIHRKADGDDLLLSAFCPLTRELRDCIGEEAERCIQAARHNIRFPRFAHPGFFAPPEWAAPRNFIATMGMPIREDGTQEGEDLTLAARNALINMIELLQERGWSREQAYIICSVAVDLRISNAVDLPNVTVSAFLPEDIFQG